MVFKLKIIDSFVYFEAHYNILTE